MKAKTLAMRVMGAGIVVLLTAGTSNATAPAGWYNDVQVKYVYGGSVGNRVAFGIVGTVNIGTCPTSEFTLNTSGAYFKEILALIMTAYASGSVISVYTDGNCTATGLAATDVRLGSP